MRYDRFNTSHPEVLPRDGVRERERYCVILGSKGWGSFHLQPAASTEPATLRDARGGVLGTLFPGWNKEKESKLEKERKRKEGREKEDGREEGRRQEGGKKKGWQVSTSCSVNSSCKSSFTGWFLPLGLFSQADIPSLSNQRECGG